MIMQLQQARKIAIIGCAGSGKTWLTLKLQEKLQLPVYHLDEYHWLPGWHRVSEETFTQVHHDLCCKSSWILEGIYVRHMPERFEHADVIVFLDIPRYQCLFNVISRAIRFHDAIIPGVPSGCTQNIFSYKFVEFLGWIWNFPRRSKPKIQAMLDEYAQGKQVIIVRSRKEMRELIEKL